MWVAWVQARQSWVSPGQRLGSCWVIGGGRLGSAWRWRSCCGDGRSTFGILKGWILVGGIPGGVSVDRDEERMDVSKA